MREQKCSFSRVQHTNLLNETCLAIMPIKYHFNNTQCVTAIILLHGLGHRINSVTKYYVYNVLHRMSSCIVSQHIRNYKCLDISEVKCRNNTPTWFIYCDKLDLEVILHILSLSIFSLIYFYLGITYLAVWSWFALCLWTCIWTSSSHCVGEIAK